MPPLQTPGRNDFANTYSAIKQRQLLGLLGKTAQSQLDLMPPGLVDTTSAAFYLLKAGTSFVYHGATADILSVFSKVGILDSGAAQPTTDVLVNGVTVLTGPITNAGANTEVAGVLDTTNTAIADGDVIELSVVVGTNSDAENLHVSIALTIS